MLNISRILILVLVLLNFSVGFSQTVTASVGLSNRIAPGIPETAVITSTYINISNCNWSSICPSITFSPMAGSTLTNNIVIVNVPRTTTCSCGNNAFSDILHITVSFTGVVNNATTVVNSTTTIPIQIWPIIVSKNNGVNTYTIAPSQTLTLHPENIPGNFCDLPSIFPASLSITQYSNGNLGYSNGFYNISCGNNLSNHITINGEYGFIGNKYAAGPLTLNVKLLDPILNSPNTLIGCGNSPASNVIFSVTPITGASSYSWTYPTNLLIPVGPVNSSTIAFDAINLGTGQISVQAIGPSNTTIKSNIVLSPIFTICCVGVTNTLSGAVTPSDTPFLYSSGKSVVMTNTIQAYAGATVYATDEVHLGPGFTAELLSSVHIYNDNCGSVYYRKSNFNRDTSNTFLLHLSERLPNEIVIVESDKDILSNNEFSFTTDTTNRMVMADDIILFPNPNTGSFMVSNNNLNNVPYTINITDIMGRRYIDQEIIEKKHVFQLNELKSGIYFVNFNYNGQNWTKKMIVVN